MSSPLQSRRSFAQAIRHLETGVSYGGMIIITLLLCSYIPWQVIGNDPSTGGDAGSHFWALHSLLTHSLPHGTLRTWNPGNLAGEPHLVHYFPFGFLFMAFLRIFVTPEMAFNLGILFPLLFSPWAIFWGVRLIGLRFPAPLLAAAFSLTLLLNESFTMWGGNGLSLFAGQFAHAYALFFFPLALGAIIYSIKRGRFPLWGTLASAAVMLSHPYVGLGLGFVYGVLILSYRRDFSTCLRLVFSGILVLLLCIWYLVPMVTNAPWTTPHSFSWISPNIFAEAFPPIFYPIALLFVGSIFVLFRRTKKQKITTTTKRVCALCGTCMGGYIGLYFLFPKLGLVDIRALPQVLYAFTLFAAITTALSLRSVRVLSPFLSLLLTLSLCGYVYYNVTKLPLWASWNLSGWKSKPLFASLSPLYAALSGTLSEPRVVYEHNMMNGGAGTERVFEMLPYFAHRATLESVYLQASIISPAVFLTQALISLTPSCPFEQYPCPSYDLDKAAPILYELGVNEFIAVTPTIKNALAANDQYRIKGNYGQWTLASLSHPPTLVEILDTPLRSVKDSSLPSSYFTLRNTTAERNDWRVAFFNWLFTRTPETPRLYHPDYGDKETIAFASTSHASPTPGECAPTVEASFSRIILTTNCPERLHLLRFSYHPSWIANDGRRPLLVSPGFMAIIPHANTLTLDFGVTLLWKICDSVSLIALVSVLIASIYGTIKKFR